MKKRFPIFLGHTVCLIFILSMHLLQPEGARTTQCETLQKVTQNSRKIFAIDDSRQDEGNRGQSASDTVVFLLAAFSYFDLK